MLRGRGLCDLPVLETSPDRARLLRMKRNGKPAEALPLYPRLFQKPPLCAEVYVGIGICHMKLAEYVEDEQAVRRALELHPSKREIHRLARNHEARTAATGGSGTRFARSVFSASRADERA